MANLIDMRRLHHGCGESLHARSFKLVSMAAEESGDEEIGHDPFAADTGGGDIMLEAENAERLWG